MTWSMRYHDGQEPGLDSNNGIFAIYDRTLHVRLEKMLKSIALPRALRRMSLGAILHLPTLNS